MKKNRIELLILAMSIWSMPTAAGTADTEIQYLLDATGKSECAFVRNGKAHNAEQAEAHLRMKYSRGKKWVDSAEQFIERIASKSSWTGQRYFIDCPSRDRQEARDWLASQLETYRSQSARDG